MKCLPLLAPVLAVALLACGGGTKSVEPPDGPPPDFVITVAPKSAGHPYAGVGSEDALVVNEIQGFQVELVRGTTYHFAVDTPGHPFYFSTDPDGGLGWPGRITLGVVGDLRSSGIVTITPEVGHPDQFFYQSGADLNMGWWVVLSDP
jgi:hypothetical protein